MPKPKEEQIKYLAFLRGINVGGHHKVPMSDVKNVLEKQGLKKVITLLNSGNVLFETVKTNTDQLEREIALELENKFPFPIPVIIYEASSIQDLFETNPFENVAITPDIRLYVSFLKKVPEKDVDLPWTSVDLSYKILKRDKKIVLSYLDLSINNTPKAMEAFDKFYGKENTTRNWKTIERIITKLK